MDAVCSSCFVSLRLPAPPPSRQYRPTRRSCFLLSSSRYALPVPAAFAGFKRPPTPLLLKRTRNFPSRSPSGVPVVAAAQFNVAKVIQTAWRVAKDGIEAGTNLVPDVVPRLIARISVAGAAMIVTLFLLKSLLSTALFVLAMMGLIYFTFIALNTDEGPKAGGGTTSTEDETLEEARRIMEKYK